MCRVFRLANHNLDYLSVLTKILMGTQNLRQLVVGDIGPHSSHIHEILLPHSNASEMFSTKRVGFSSLGLFLARGGLSFCLQSDILLVQGHSVVGRQSSLANPHG